MGSKSRWTPCRETSAPRPPSVATTLSISSRKTMPTFSASSIARAFIFSELMSASQASSNKTLRASATVISRCVVLRGITFSNSPCRSKSICSAPIFVNIIGADFCSTAISILRCSISPARSIARIFSRVRVWRSLNSAASSFVSFTGGSGARISSNRASTLSRACVSTAARSCSRTMRIALSTNSRIMLSTSRP